MGSPFTNTPVLDTFSGGDGAPGASWTTPASTSFDVSAMSVLSAQLRATVQYGSLALWNASKFTNGEVFVTIPVLPAAGEKIDLYLRAGPTPGSVVTAYVLRIFWDGTSSIRKVVDSVDTWLASAGAPAWAAGDKGGFSVAGTTLRAYRYTGGTWGQLATVEDSSITAAGYCGIGTSDYTVARFDDFGGGDAVTTLASDTPMPIMGRGATW